MKLAMFSPWIYYRPWQLYQLCPPSALTQLGLDLPGPVEHKESL